MGLGGPVWHVSARAATEAMSWAMAERALDGVGDATLGEWRERGRNGIMHIRRRLTDDERRIPGRPSQRLQVRDIRGTPEADRRIRQLFGVPAIRPYVIRPFASSEVG